MCEQNVTTAFCNSDSNRNGDDNKKKVSAGDPRGLGVYSLSSLLLLVLLITGAMYVRGMSPRPGIRKAGYNL